MLTIPRDILVGAILVGTLVFNFLLCIANTLVFRTTDSVVMLCELALIGGALVLAIDRRPWFFLAMALYGSYMAVILALRPELDLKAIRDFLIPLAFYFLGRRDGDVATADRLMLGAGVLVLAVGLIEYFFLLDYTRVVNILQYYVARGTLAEVPEFLAGGPGLFASGMRFQDRNLLGFLLSPHRVSSIFLEPVGAGNFGAILYLWALARRDMRWRWTTALLGIAAIVLSDARFGSYVCVLATPIAVLAPRLSRLWWLVLPFAIALALSLNAALSPTSVWEDNFPGRLLQAGLLLNRLEIWNLLGIGLIEPAGIADSGYAYSFNQIGLVGFAVLWAALLFARENDPDAWRWKALAATFLALSLVVSNSPYTIKTGGLFWFALGALDARRRFLPSR